MRICAQPPSWKWLDAALRRRGRGAVKRSLHVRCCLARARADACDDPRGLNRGENDKCDRDALSGCGTVEALRQSCWQIQVDDLAELCRAPRLSGEVDGLRHELGLRSRG